MKNSNITYNPILKRLREEKDHKISGGLYHELQIRMAYNSNHIEGSSLSEEQTRSIFETNSLHGGENIDVDDIIEAVNHFGAFDYCIDVAEEELTEDIVKYIHYLLKSGTSGEKLSWFKVGEYKTMPNMVGGIETSSPEDVNEDMKSLLKAYGNKTDIFFEDIVEFHFNFERVHPFQDGNGRVGRLVAFKECLKNKITPFIVEDSKKSFYYRGLNEYKNDSTYLIETCYDGQDTIKAMINVFGIK